MLRLLSTATRCIRGRSSPSLPGRPVEVQLLYPDMGIAEPLAAVADRYDLDREALEAAAQSALAAPNRVVSVDVAAASPA
jgi:hypothetical protein